MKWIKTSEELPPIQRHVITCRKLTEEGNEAWPYAIEIMSLHRRIKKTGREEWITWHSLDHIEFTKDQERPEYWMNFPELPK